VLSYDNFLLKGML